MESEGIELDDIQVVEVTGKRYRDRQPRSNKSKCDCCTSSLRVTTLLIIACIALVVIIYLCIGIIVMFDSLEDLDVTYSNTSVNRFAMMVVGDMEKMRQYTLLNGFTPYSGWALRNYSLYKQGKVSKQDFDYALMNFTFGMVYTPNMWTGVPEWNSGSEHNFISLLDVDCNTVPGAAWFHPGNATTICLPVPSTPPVIKPESYKNMIATDPNANVWMSLFVPDDGGDTRPMMLTFIPVKMWGVVEEVPDDNVYGYLVFGRSIFPRLHNGGSYVDDVPTCVTIEDGKEEASKWDAQDKKAFAAVKAGTAQLGSDAYCGEASFAQRDNETIARTKGRMCPDVPLFESTPTLMVGYMKLCGLDPAVYGEANCIKIRVDRPMSFVQEGTTPVVTVSCLIVALMIVICIIFIIFLDCVVLRRIESLSKVIRKQTRGHARAQEDEDESTAVPEEKGQTAKYGKSGKSSKSKSGTSASGTSATSDSSAATTATNASATTTSKGGLSSAHDELGALKSAMEQNAVGLRKRLEAVNDAIKIEQQKTVHRRQAMQLLNLWCGRKDYFPGLRPNAMQLRYEPTRNLDDILNNSLAIEYLKIHCENDHTMENLWFLLDVSWLEELEAAEDEEDRPDKRAQLHDVAVCAAKTIVRRYIAADAPQQINISAGTFKKLRKVGEQYSRKMFSEAVSEVKLMLDTDILPRFKKTSSYSAMSETLFIESSGGGESSSELSDETVSTAGSILTDEEEEGGVGRIFAKTFKNLHTAFDVGHGNQTESSSTHDTEDREIETSTKDGATTEASEKNSATPKPDEEKKAEEEPKAEAKEEAKEEPKKEPKEEAKEEPKEEAKEKKEEEPKESDKSSESNSISSDSLTVSSSSSDDDE